jgi:hypothetical protein
VFVYARVVLVLAVPPLMAHGPAHVVGGYGGGVLMADPGARAHL